MLGLVANAAWRSRAKPRRSRDPRGQERGARVCIAPVAKQQRYSQRRSWRIARNSPSSTVLLVAELTKSGQCWAKARPRKPMPTITRLINRQSWLNRPGCAANSHAPETAMGSLRCTLASARVPASMQPTTNTDQAHIKLPVPAKP